MYIVQIRARIKTVCAASEICYGEIELALPKGKYLYVTVLEDELTHFSVSKESVYDYISDEGKKAPKLLEEYTAWTKAKTSKYAEYFKIIKRNLKEICGIKML